MYELLIYIQNYYLYNLSSIIQKIFKIMEPETVLPVYQLVEAKPEEIKHSIHVIGKDQVDLVVQANRECFTKDGYTVLHEGGKETHFVTAEKICKCSITKDTYVEISNALSAASDYYGVVSDLLACHKFSRKQKKPAPIKIYVNKNVKDAEHILTLARAKNQDKELCNGRGDQEGVPTYFEKLAQDFAKENGIQITVIRGDDLIKEGFRLMHAVGRASKNIPVFVNLSYKGNPDSDKWVAYVGKGVCFDAGGLDIKTAAGMKEMHLDKCGAVAVFTAFQYVVKQKIKINLTASMGFVQNFISSVSYRPSDIIKSRKGLTVQIGNTDAEGRLVLADCMHWTQQKYKTDVLIELSTLTGAIITALGHKHSGLFTNNEGLCHDFIAAGKQVHQLSWHMPLEDYHRQLVKHKFADITNSSGKTQASSSQAAAFLQNFVEKQTKWIHLDIAGTSMVGGEGSGYGARVLIQYARNYVNKAN